MESIKKYADAKRRISAWLALKKRIEVSQVHGNALLGFPQRVHSYELDTIGFDAMRPALTRVLEEVAPQVEARLKELLEQELEQLAEGAHRECIQLLIETSHAVDGKDAPERASAERAVQPADPTRKEDDA